MTDSVNSASAAWPAPTAAGPVAAVVPVPGSKSATNRALVLAALAGGPSVLRRPLRSRDETDRLAALAKELGNLGGEVAEEAEALVITPRPLHGGLFATYEDHRLATAAAVLGLVVPGIEVENVATTQKTLPDFPERWTAMLAGREYRAGTEQSA